VSSASTPQLIRAGSGADYVEFYANQADIWARFQREGGRVDLYRVDTPAPLPDIYTDEQRRIVPDLPGIHTLGQRLHSGRRWFVLHNPTQGTSIISRAEAERITNAAPFAVLRGGTASERTRFSMSWNNALLANKLGVKGASASYGRRQRTWWHG
jgi:hypothetical protein